MSGYFRRLLTQAAITTAQLRPVTTHPYATLASSVPSGDLPGGRDPHLVRRAGLVGPVDVAGAPGAGSGDDDSARGNRHVDLVGEERDRFSDAEDAARATRTGAMEIADRDARSGQRHPGVTRRQRSDGVRTLRRSGGPPPPGPGNRDRSSGDESSLAHARRGDDSERRVRTGAEGTSSNTTLQAGAPAHADALPGDVTFRLLPEDAAGDRWPAAGIAISGVSSRRHDPVRRTQAGAGDDAPEIHVTIGRIEVTAQHAAAPAKKRREQPAAMSLDDYLARRRQGGA